MRARLQAGRGGSLPGQTPLNASLDYFGHDWACNATQQSCTAVSLANLAQTFVSRLSGSLTARNLGDGVCFEIRLPCVG